MVGRIKTSNAGHLDVEDRKWLIDTAMLKARPISRAKALKIMVQRVSDMRTVFVTQGFPIYPQSNRDTG